MGCEVRLERMGMGRAIVIQRCMTRLLRNQCENVPSGLIMFGYFLVAMRFLSSSEIGGP